MKNILLGQLFGILATILTFVSYQANTKKGLLIIQSIATSFTCLSFLFLDALTGFALNIVCLLRNAVFYFQGEKSKLHTPTVIVLTACMIGVGMLSWQNYMSLLPLIALAANTVFMSFGNPQLLRKSILITSTMMIIYNVFVFSLGGIANESIAIISSVIGIVRFQKMSSNTCSNEAENE